MALPDFTLPQRIQAIRTHYLDVSGNPLPLTQEWQSGITIYYLVGGYDTALNSNPATSGAEPMNPNQLALANKAFGLWADLIGANLQSGSDPNTGRPNIGFDWSTSTTGGGEYTDPSGVAASVGTYYAGVQDYKLADANVWISSSWDENIHAKTLTFDQIIGGSDPLASRALESQLHEIGHALGLSHTGFYNGSAPSTGPAYV